MLAERCIRCGERITAELDTELHRKYTEHVVKVHGLPSNVEETGA